MGAASAPTSSPGTTRSIPQGQRAGSLFTAANCGLTSCYGCNMSTILITGATSGIGFEAAVALARQGNRLVLVGRDQEKMNATVDEVRRRTGVAAAADSWLCEFGSQAQIRKLA